MVVLESMTVLRRRCNWCVEGKLRDNKQVALERHGDCVLEMSNKEIKMTTYHQYRHRQTYSKMQSQGAQRGNRAVLWTLIMVIVGAALALTFGEASGMPLNAAQFLG
jgi:hypothetical protein